METMNRKTVKRMRKADHKRMTGSAAGVQDRLRHKHIFCTSRRWVKWAKKYIARAQRRKQKHRREE